MVMKKYRFTEKDKSKENVYPLLERLIEIVNSNLDRHVNLQHASNLIKKIRDNSDSTKVAALAELLPLYISYYDNQESIIGYGEKEIKARVDCLERYYTNFNELHLNDLFSSQGKFRSTVLEEFMCFVFRDFIEEIKAKYGDSGENSVIFNGASKSYTNMYIAPPDIESFIHRPQMEINEKDQDYAIYRTINITIEGNDQPKVANIPIIAIENKTFLDKTMLDSAIATAEKVKSGNPYALYMVVTETYDVDIAVDPIYSRIDQIYVLRKCKRAKGDYAPYPIDYNVVKNLFNRVREHMGQPWSRIQERLQERGEILY